ncbi:tellurite resistance protein TerC [Arcticibacter pallidicorallinus]|uniref:Tellurite resistance protein TerC n=1 Tax=Arcticibacter pallidicorallinus TaxID=1259464 RepID=A0A2T0U3W8_9SPHI|nr:TerC family protein [Arcticibacter pallidicorallinus]PRY52615.1 tellurite resistance protein TerC [Arcticibacter pallidicorallinus]
MEVTSTFWIGFNLFVLLMLALDLGVFNRKAHVVSVKEALTWSGVWICLSLVFNGLIYHWFGEAKAIEFFTGYVIEKSLSVDNIFVFVLVFKYFQIPSIYQHKILFWGILGALVMRVIFIFAGVALIEKFHWTIYLFGLFLIYTGYKMFTEQDKQIEPEKNPVIKFFRRVMPVTHELRGDKFFVAENGRRHATPLFLVLILIETTDLIFAVDSIPAILAVTQDRFIVYTSNVFAILGLRSLYFALAHVIHRFVYLSTGLAVILVFVGLKMVLVDVIKIPTHISLIVIALIITASIVFSLMKTKNEKGLDSDVV